jgi:hypothetical protein
MAFFAGMPFRVIVQFFLAFVILLGPIGLTARGAPPRQRPAVATARGDRLHEADRRRRLILVRCDDVEHLLMIGWQCCPTGSR